MIKNCGECYRRWYCCIDPRECNKLTDSIPVTNADLIRSMSDQGLALCLYEIGYVGGWYSKKDVLEWLQQPAKEVSK